MTPNIVALAICKHMAQGVSVQVIPLLDEDAKAACRHIFEMGYADVIGALTKQVSVQHVAAFVPGIARCPEVAWIAVREEDKRAFDKENTH